jgi:4-amino-4-deoxy-L-arabinose transferase-like glycosyltransferase
VILVVAALGRDRAPLRLLGPAWGWSLFALIGLPWYLLAILRTPGLLHYLLVNQIWERYTTHVHHRAGPAWYFVAVLAGGSMPWLAAMAAGLTRLTRTRALAESRLLLGWLLIPLVFFSFSGSKLPAYLLPCFPAVALIAALGFEHGGGAVRWGTAALLAATALAGWIIGPALFARAIGLHAVPPAALPPAAHMAFVTMLWAASWFARGRAGGGGLLALFGWALLVVAAAPYEAPLGSPRLLARLIAENRAPEEPLVEYAELNAGVPFYLRELLPLLEVPRETWWEDPAMRPSVVIGRDSLASLVSRRGRVWILGPAGRMQALADTLGLSFEPTASWRRSVLGFLSR